MIMARELLRAVVTLRRIDLLVKDGEIKAKGSDDCSARTSCNGGDGEDRPRPCLMICCHGQDPPESVCIQVSTGL